MSLARAWPAFALVVTGCASAPPIATPAADAPGLAYRYPATHAGCYAFRFERRDGAPAPAPYPSRVRLDTQLVVLGVPEAVGFHAIVLPSEWSRRLPGRHYWSERGDSVFLVYEGAPGRSGLQLELTVRGDTLVRGGAGPWNVIGHRRACRDLGGA